MDHRIKDLNHLINLILNSFLIFILNKNGLSILNIKTFNDYGLYSPGPVLLLNLD